MHNASKADWTKGLLCGSPLLPVPLRQMKRCWRSRKVRRAKKFFCLFGWLGFHIFFKFPYFFSSTSHSYTITFACVRGLFLGILLKYLIERPSEVIIREYLMSTGCLCNYCLVFPHLFCPLILSILIIFVLFLRLCSSDCLETGGDPPASGFQCCD